jgi:hypothetical protein
MRICPVLIVAGICCLLPLSSGARGIDERDHPGDDEGRVVVRGIWAEEVLKLTFTAKTKTVFYCRVRFWPEGSRSLVAPIESGGAISVTKGFPYMPKGRESLPRAAEVTIYLRDASCEPMYRQSDSYLFMRTGKGEEPQKEAE